MLTYIGYSVMHNNRFDGTARFKGLVDNEELRLWYLINGFEFNN